MASKEATAIVLDIGKSMFDCLPVFEEAKACISMIIQRKIFSESKDEVALLLFGVSHSENEDSDDASPGYEHIALVRELLPPSWDILNYIKKIKATSISTDSIRANALLSAIDLLQNATAKKKFTSRRILFISNFDGYICSDKIDDICADMKRHSIDLNVIGPDAFPVEDVKIESCMESDEKISVPKAENGITKILYEVNGESYSFSDVHHALMYYQMKKKLPFAWNANLEIGDLSIPVSAFIKTTEMKPEPWKKAYAFKPESRIENRTTFSINDESQTEVSKEDLISAYKYGCTLVPFSEEDKRNMNYEPGERGIKILGFTKSENVQRHHYVGENTLYVFGRKNDECAGTRLAAFIQGLRDTKMLALARYVYNIRSAPKIGILFPKVKENCEYLMFIAMPFLEDLRHYLFSSLDADSKNIPTEEQLDAIDELITDMDLTVSVHEDDEELLKPKNTVNPYLQRLFQCLEFRALHPEKPLPEMEAHLEALVNPPPELLKRAEKSVKKVESLFQLKRAEVKQKGRKYGFSNEKHEEFVKKKSIGDDSAPEEKFVPETSLADAVTDKITEVGSINPVRDFQFLVANKVISFNNICDQLVNVVFKYLKDSGNLRMFHQKILSICKEFRRASLKDLDDFILIITLKEEAEEEQKESSCNKYNDFMSKLKDVLIECEDDLWDKIKSEKISLISDQELSSSTVSVEQAELFLCSPSLTENKNSAIESIEMKVEDEDDDDLLDQL